VDREGTTIFSWKDGRDEGGGKTQNKKKKGKEREEAGEERKREKRESRVPSKKALARRAIEWHAKENAPSGRDEDEERRGATRGNGKSGT